MINGEDFQKAINIKSARETYCIQEIHQPLNMKNLLKCNNNILKNSAT